MSTTSFKLPLLTCEGCGEPCEISIFDSNPFQINYKCQACRAFYHVSREKVPMKEEEDFRGIGFCKRHNEEENKFFCKNCKEHFCSKCISQCLHKNEDHFVTLSELTKKEEFSKKIKEARLSLQRLHNKLKNLCEDKMNLIFQKHFERNTLILDFVEALEKTYNPNNYITISNLTKNTNFTFLDLEVIESESLEQILRKIENDNIISFDKNTVGLYEPPIKINLLSHFYFHKETISSCCVLKDKRIAVLSMSNLKRINGKLRIINTKNGNCEGIFMSDTKDFLFCTTFEEEDDTEEKLYVCTQNTIEIIKIVNKSIEILGMFITDLFPFRIVHLSKTRMAVSYNKKNFCIKIFEKTSAWNYELLYYNLRHNGRIMSMIKLKSKNVLVSGSCDGGSSGDSTVKFWEANNFQPIATFPVPCNSLFGLTEINNSQVAVASGNAISIINHQSNKIEYQSTFRGTIGVSYLIDQENLLIGDVGGFLIIFNLRYKYHIYNKKLDYNGINNIQFIDEGKILVSGIQDTIEIYSVEKRHAAK